MTAASAAEFHAWSPEHFAALGVSAVIGVVMIVVGRSKNARAARVAEIAFASLLAAQWPLSYWMHYNAGTLTPDNSYPCHFCDIATLFGILALLTHRWALAWACAVGCGFSIVAGVWAIWSRQVTVLHGGEGPGFGLVLAVLGAVVLTYSWVRIALRR